MLQILPPATFRHAGQLPAKAASNDPRPASFGEDLVDIDLRACEFIYPPAILWCAVFGALVRRAHTPCRLLVPQNVGVATYLKSIGLFDLLRDAGAEVDDRDLRETSSTQVVLPLTRFSTATEAEDLANRALERLNQTGQVAANLRHLIAETFGELANNAAEHSESTVGSFGMIQFYDVPNRGQRFSCAVADGGLGIWATLERNPQLRPLVPYDWVAIERAVRERTCEAPGGFLSSILG